MEIISPYQILSLLPHRYPFLLVDKITKIGHKNIEGIKNVTFNEPHFMGHFPEYPVMPGVLIIESLAQVSAILVAKENDIIDRGKKIVYLSGINNARFRAPVVPGDMLILKAEYIHSRSNTWKLGTQAFVEDKLVSEATIIATLKDR